ncbi:MAG: FIG00971038: hypothetical protein [uncultured Sulfurovum sp.]|uniref:FAD dependent oxidoreductase domain-containing protein n=1 Tax=uncultured Sulfurovum sp. TaxID=269237 RepID=A0A6S6SZP3_9BACT|nr:MAG: FIG00971038: hypothetical protein [uncultured Sulfurovum sp.]
MLNENIKVAIIGAGVAGASTAITLGKLGMNVTLFEKESSLVSGPPFCHLHAGGNLYREISDKQCVTLLKQSINFLRFYPFIIDYRPTVIALPLNDKSTPKALLPRLNLLVDEYKKLIQKDAQNKVLGESTDYYKCYDRAELVALQTKDYATSPNISDEWMISVAKNIDLNKIQFPLILVQEYGLNLFRLASGTMLILKKLDSVSIRTETSVTAIKREKEQFNLTFKSKDNIAQGTFDYIINATGFRTGQIDDMLDAPCKRMVEFKAAYVSKCDNYENIFFPEIIFHGERGTPEGMGQFTPYPNGYVQLHGMTTDITLYKDGLVANSSHSCQPQLSQNFVEKIEKSWEQEETRKRTHLAIQHLSKFIPNFSTAKVASKPLFGAQQIPGDDPTLRVAEVSFPSLNYARCEIVKVSSVIDMVESIIKKLITLEYLSSSAIDKVKSIHLENILLEEEIDVYARELAITRNYPSSLAERIITKSVN